MDARRPDPPTLAEVPHSLAPKPWPVRFLSSVPPFQAFVLDRLHDPSGISGVGFVAVGVVLPSGRVVLEWLTVAQSIALYKDLAEIEKVHGHNGDTLIRWL